MGTKMSNVPRERERENESKQHFKKIFEQKRKNGEKSEKKIIELKNRYRFLCIALRKKYD